MKSIFVSKTFYFGIVQIVFGGVGIFFGFLDQQAGFALIMSGLGTIGFRFTATQPVSISGSSSV